MIVSDLDSFRINSRADQVQTMLSRGTVMAVDPALQSVQVALRGDPDAVVWLAAVAGRYKPGGSCLVAHDLASGGRAVGVVGAGDVLPSPVVGTLTALGADFATVRVLDTEAAVIPYLPSTYDVGDRVWVTLNDWGTPVRVDGPTSQDAAPRPVAPPAGGGGSRPTVQTTVAIAPQWSGSWSGRAGAWDRWNTGRYGGRSTLYQGNGFGSGPMTGLAVYGNQLVNLGAVSIDRVAVALRPVGLSGASGPATVQGSPHAQQPPGAPSASGPTASGDGVVELPAGLREALRTGAAKGLALVGANYWAVAGAGNGDGMVLTVTFSRYA